MNQTNYFVAEEIHHHAERSEGFHLYKEIVIFNADQEESYLLNHIICNSVASSSDHAATLIPYFSDYDFTDIVETDNIRILQDYKEYRRVSHGGQALFVIFNNHNLYVDTIKTQLSFLEENMLLTETDRMLYITESDIDDFVYTKYFEVSEEEYSELIKEQTKNQYAKKNVALEGTCEEWFANGYNVTVVRYNNLFGPTINRTKNLVSAISRDVSQTKEITFEVDDKNVVRSYTYICDLLRTVERFIVETPKFHTYNLNSYILSDYHIKTTLSLSVPEAKLLFPPSLPAPNIRCSILQCVRIRRIVPKVKRIFRTAIERTYYTRLGNEAFDKKDEERLSRKTGGKIDIIRSLEVDILREVDRICKKYGLTYFLVGGTLLGAIRHKGFIPWDDDLDVGMLRESYDKFRRVAPFELNDRFYYQTHSSNDGSHYVFDKIRVNDTLFSTAWSARFQMVDGVFVDILCYDKTSNHKPWQKLHIELISIVKRSINLKWINYPRKHIHYALSIVSLPFIRCAPFSWLFWAFEKTVRLFQHSRKSHYLLDSLGMNIRKVKAFPRSWFENLTMGEFEGVEVPIPAKYDDYLRRWYGDDYMQLLLPSQREGHRIVEMNVGKYAQKPHV